MLTLPVIITLLVSYLAGAIPFGYMIGRLFGRVDIRQHGSGNIGATNVGRILGWPFFALVFTLDFAKGALPVLVAGWLMKLEVVNSEELPAFLQKDGLPMLAGLAAIVGHMWPVYLWFRGGKGVATSAGVVAMLLPIPTLLAAGTWIIVLLGTHYVSLSSITAAIALCLARLVEVWRSPFSDNHRTLTIFCLVGAALVILRHRSNMVRLWNGTESRVGRRRPAALTVSDK